MTTIQIFQFSSFSMCWFLWWFLLHFFNLYWKVISLCNRQVVCDNEQKISLTQSPTHGWLFHCNASFVFVLHFFYIFNNRMHNVDLSSFRNGSTSVQANLKKLFRLFKATTRKLHFTIPVDESGSSLMSTTASCWKDLDLTSLCLYFWSEWKIDATDDRTGFGCNSQNMLVTTKFHTKKENLPSLPFNWPG